jgi:hypothetical protein
MTAAEREWDRLATALNQHGIRHVAPGQPWRCAFPSDPTALVFELATAANVRLQQAVVPFLLTFPELAGAAQEAIAQLQDPQRDKAMRRYVDATAMQRMWRTRLQLALGEQPLIPPAYLEELELPPLNDAFGQTTLRVLAQQEEERYGYDAWATYAALMDLVLGEIELRQWGRRGPPPAPATTRTLGESSR